MIEEKVTPRQALRVLILFRKKCRKRGGWQWVIETPAQKAAAKILKKDRSKLLAGARWKKYYWRRRDSHLLYYKVYQQTLRGRHKAIRSGAIKRNISFAITENDLALFWKKPCYYCGAKIYSVGLDRKDSSLGYSLDNVVSCCKECNFAKRKMGEMDFISMCISIAGKHFFRTGQRERFGIEELFISDQAS